MGKKEIDPEAVYAAFKIKCPGSEPPKTMRDVDAIVVITNDGNREVNCAFLGDIMGQKDFARCLNSIFVGRETQADCKYLNLIGSQNYLYREQNRGAQES